MSFYELNEKVLALESSGKKIIKLNVGHTALSTPNVAINAAVSALQTTKSAYGSSKGFKPFLKAIAKRENVGEDSVCVGPGSKQLLFALLSILRKTNKKVVTPAPYWPAYPLIAEHLSFLFESIPTTLKSSWALPNLPLEQGSVVVICNPNNPTSTIFDYAALSRTTTEADKFNIPVIIDEPYRDIAFSSINSVQNAIRIRSFSKEFNMEGFRLGYVVGDPNLISELVKFNQITITCVAPFIQEAGLKVLENKDEILSHNRNIWEERLNYLSNSLMELGFSFVNPQAGMYIFATHPKIIDSYQFCIELLDKGVAVAPGTGFGDYPNFIRISASENILVLKDAISIIKSCL